MGLWPACVVSNEVYYTSLIVNRVRCKIGGGGGKKEGGDGDGKLPMTASIWAICI